MTVDSASPAEAEAERSIAGFAWTHAAALIAALPFVMAGVRVLFYSGGDPVVLKALVETVNITTLLLGTFLPLLPLLALFFFQTMAFNGVAFSRIWRTRWGRGALLLVYVVWMLIGQLPTTLWVTVGLIAGLVSRVLLRRLAPKFLDTATAYLGPTKSRSVDSTSVIATAGVLIFVLAVPQGMWVPLERLSLDGEGDKIAYVLEDSEGWTTTIAQNRSIDVFKSAEVTGRVVCDQGNYQSLMTLMTRSDPSPRDECKD